MIIVRGCRMKLRRSAVLRHKDQADGRDRRRAADGRAAGDGALPRGELRVAAICGKAALSAGVAAGRFAERRLPPEAQALFSRRSRLGASRGTSVGLTCSSTTSRVITHRATSLRLGMSYITESRTSSAVQDCDESDVLVPDLLTWRVRSWSVGTPAIRTSDHGQYPVRDMPKAARVLAALQRDCWTETRRRGSQRVLVKDDRRRVWAYPEGVDLVVQRWRASPRTTATPLLSCASYRTMIK